MIKGIVSSYISSPQGMETICTYISSEAGQRAIRDYLSTPGGKQIAKEILPLLLESVELPDDLKNAVKENSEKKN
jgi:hypothetical protein